MNKYLYKIKDLEIPLWIKRWFLKRSRGQIIELEGVPPLIFQSNGRNLLDYRIDGASGGVGDRTDNLFDGILLDGYYTNNTLTTLTSSTGVYKSLKVNLPAGTYTVVYSEPVLIIRYIELNGDYMANPAGKSAVESYTFTLNNNSTISLGFRNSTNTQWDNSVKIQVVTGSIVPSKYEPYGYKVPVMVEGKNLLQNTATSTTINGVTFTVNSDGSVACNGTANGGKADFWIPGITLPAGQYSINGCPAGGTENETYKILIFVNDVWRTNDKGSGANFTLTETSTVSVRITIYNGYTCDNLTFYPMIRKADIEDDTYEPFTEPTTTNIYLDEPIEENESISLSDTNVPIPTLNGTNILTVDTTVQPSKVYIKTSTRATRTNLNLQMKNLYNENQPFIVDSTSEIQFSKLGDGEYNKEQLEEIKTNEEEEE